MFGRGAQLALIPALLGLAACAPIPVDQAERVCLNSVSNASGPRTEVGFGLGSGGFRGGYVQVGMSTSDNIMGRDPSRVFQDCVQRRSGQQPRVPLYEQPGWRAR